MSRDTQPWYKQWWGIILAILVWPIFLGWLMWKKAVWPAPIKVLATVGLLACCFVVAGMWAGGIDAISGGVPAKNTSLTTAAVGSSKKQPAANITFGQVTETASIPFTTTTQNDSTLPAGQTKVIQAGQNGSTKDTYEVSYTNGKEKTRKLVTQQVITQPVNAVVANGTYVAPAETLSQKNAVSSAKDYLNTEAFSHDGLVAQLEFDQFSAADATYGADNSGADWNAQAAKSAKDYLATESFSHDGLITQLEYDKFTPAQATYGVNAVGL